MMIISTTMLVMINGRGDSGGDQDEGKGCSLGTKYVSYSHMTLRNCLPATQHGHHQLHRRTRGTGCSAARA